MSDVTFIPVSRNVTPWQVQRHLEAYERQLSGLEGANAIGFGSGGVFTAANVGAILLELATSIAAASFPRYGNVCHVDAVFGNDATGDRSGLPFLTVAAAIAAAQSGDVVYITPGTYPIVGGIVLPDGVNMTGMNHNATVVISAAAADTVLLTMGNGCLVENITFLLESTGHHQLTGVLFPGNTAATSSVEGCSIHVHNDSADVGGTSEVYGVHITPTGSDAYNDALNDSVIHVHSAGFGAKRGILVDTSAGFFSCMEVDVVVLGVGGNNYFGLEVAFAGATLQFKMGVVSGVTSDVSQTLGTLVLGIPNVYHSTANGLGFSTILTAPTLNWGDNGVIPSGTRYLYRGTATSSASREPKSNFAQKTVVWLLAIHAAVGPGVAHTDTWVVRKNGVDTALVGTLTGIETAANITNISVSFAAGDDISIKMVVSAGSTTQDVQVTVSYT